MFDKRLLKIDRDSKYDFNKSNYLRLDANERVIPFSKKDISFIKNKINNYYIQSYPTYRFSVAQILSKKEKINIDQITITPGADAVLKYIFEIISKKKGNILSVYPTYGMIDVYSKIYNRKHIKISEQNLEKFLLKKNYKNIALVYIANPNSPSGKIISKDIILEIAKNSKKRNILFVIDEAYIEYSKNKSLKNLIKKNNNIIIIRTYSKFYGIAGLRIGHIMANKKIIKAINSIRPPHDISNLSLSILNYFLTKKKDTYIKDINKSKKFIINFCRKNKIEIFMTEANFFHIFLEKQIILPIIKYMKKNKILVKSNYLNFSNVSYLGPKNTIRVSIGSIRQMKLFFNKLKKILIKIS